MSKMRYQMSKYKPGDRFIVEITGVDNEALPGYPHTAYQVKGAGCFSENVLDKLERIEPNMAAVQQNNADRIRAMSDEKLAEFFASIQCPDEDMIVICNKEFFAEVEILKWLQKEATNGQT